MLESHLTMQKILEAEDHKARCNLLRHFVDAERSRLSAKKTLKGMFTGSVASADMPTEETLPDKASEEDMARSKKRSIFTDEPDAFQ
jgi:hypothetical protein